ncbi:MAG TPA: exosome complex RNA-binding protein Csl4 [Methanomassiliicoccales archaeon]|nr:exosome complex RNA-binding protein Csl4 [Methanomassiliicoccales archaeon]
MKTKRPVLPGDEVAEAEEFLPGEGTYEENGKIYAALAGELELDDEEKTVTVKATNPMIELKGGESVFCAVTDVRSVMAICEVVAVEGVERNVTGDTNGTIHISKMSQDYTQDASREMRPSDIIRAKVISSKPSVQLTTAGDHLGVVKALCRRCRAPLVRNEKGLYCNNCDRYESRKVADDYGAVEY